MHVYAWYGFDAPKTKNRESRPEAALDTFRLYAF
jgi:hypothetical protein